MLLESVSGRAEAVLEALSEVCLMMWLVDVMFGKAAELDKTFLH